MSDLNPNNNNAPSPDPSLIFFSGSSLTSSSASTLGNSSQKLQKTEVGNSSGHSIREISPNTHSSSPLTDSSFTIGSDSPITLNKETIEVLPSPNHNKIPDPNHIPSTSKEITPSQSINQTNFVAVKKQLQERSFKKKLLQASPQRQKLPHLYPPKIGHSLELLTSNSKAEITIIHSNQKETIHSRDLSVLPPQEKGSTPPCLLIFGVHESRQNLFDELTSTLHVGQRIPMMVMNELNRYIGIEQPNIFLKLFLLKKGNFSVNQTLLQHDITAYYSHLPQEKTSQLLPLVQKWGHFLENHRDAFNFSERLQRKDWISFFLKNIHLQSGQLLYQQMVPEEKFSLKALQRVEKLLAPGKEFLLNIFEALEHSPDQASFIQASQLITPPFENLMPELQEYSINLLQNAIWRKTSKLGLSFAAEQGIPVFFSWQLPGQEEDVNAIIPLLEVAPHKANPPHCYRYRTTEVDISEKNISMPQYQKKPISVSEFHEMGRLLYRQLRHPEDEIAPNFLLIQKIGKLSSENK
jgi:hypothetical protein